MTEQDWLTSEDVRTLLIRLGPPRGAARWWNWWAEPEPDRSRKFRLFGVAVWEAWLRRGDTSNVPAGEMVEHNLAWIDEPFELKEQDIRRWNLHTMRPMEFAESAVENYTKAGIKPVRMMTRALLDANRRRLPTGEAADLLREVIGNPFRTNETKSERDRWIRACSNSFAGHLGDAIATAREIYATRSFTELPVLADALDDAQFGMREVIDHFRSPDRMCAAAGRWI